MKVTTNLVKVGLTQAGVVSLAHQVLKGIQWGRRSV